MKHKCLTWIVVAGLCLTLTGTASARRQQQQNRFRFDAERMVDRYLEQLDKQTDNYCQRLEFRTDKCVEWLTGLLMIGEEEQAAQLADDAIRWINWSSQIRIDHINRQSQVLVLMLQRFGYDDLADEVTEAANQAVLNIQYAAEDAIQTINDLFYWDDGPGEYAE